MADPATYREAVGDFIARPGHGWAGLPFFAGAAQALAERLDEKRQAGAVICPPPEQVFAALRATPLGDVRAVILGQDPYPTPGHAVGLSFSVAPTVRPLPRSLQNIFRELVAGTQEYATLRRRLLRALPRALPALARAALTR